MDSINAQQPEKNHEDLGGQDAIQEIKTIVEKSPSCFFCTSSATGESRGSRPMSVQQVDDEGSLWFLSANDSHKNQEIALNPTVKLYFQGSGHSDFLSLEGQASISTDKEKIKELWNPILKTWFTEGVDDPRITAIEIAPAAGYYWDTKHGNAVSGIKILVGAALGKTLDDSIEGKIDI